MGITKYSSVQSSLQGFTMALWGYFRDMQEGTNGHQLTDLSVGMDGIRGLRDTRTAFHVTSWGILTNLHVLERFPACQNVLASLSFASLSLARNV